MIVNCPYCCGVAELVTGEQIYPGHPHLWSRHFWLCASCNAYVGTHRDSADHAPLGRLADATLRKEKQRAHAAFDPLWRAKMKRESCGKKAARNAGYKWLALQLGIDRNDCHIGMFDVAMCQRVVAVCEERKIGRGEAA